MEREFRPGFEVLTAYFLLFILAWGAAEGIISLLPLPGYNGLLQDLSGVPIAIFFMAKSVPVILLNRTERYALDEKELTIQRGLLRACTERIPIRSVVRVGTEASLLSKHLGIGTVWVHTVDHTDIPLYNLTDARKVAYRLNKLVSGEPFELAF